MRPVLLVAGFLLVTTPVAATAQTATGGKWVTPRTPDGRPDLQGMWTTQTFTPLQRPDRFAGREFLTDQEMDELLRLVSQEGVDPLAGTLLAVSDEERNQRVKQTDPTHYNNAVWLATPQPKSLSSRRTSLIVDPSDGKLPPLTPEGQKRLAARRALNGFDSYVNRPLQERCVVWTHEGPPMLPPPYNDVMQILQTPGYVVVHRELSTNLPRMIPTTERQPLPDGIRQWAGVSRGRWEGDTLVVETTNYNDKVAIQGSSAALRVTERFTRVSADKIDYRFTVEDPTNWTRPWTAELPMIRTQGQPYEYACHEGNYGVVNILKGARAADHKPAAAAPAPPTPAPATPR